MSGSRNKLGSCPFCNNGTDAVFAESKNFVALYNIAPILPGHSLVVPRRHVESLMDLSKPALAELMVFSRDVVKILSRAFNTGGFNWTIQEKEEAGQSVGHLHLHLIPRKPKDLPEPGDWYPLLKQKEAEIIDSAKRARLKPQELRRIVAEIKSSIPD